MHIRIEDADGVEILDMEEKITGYSELKMELGLWRRDRAMIIE